MNDDEPLAFFITWTVYGTHLQGDVRGWRRRCKGEQTSQPLLAKWRSERLKYSIQLLNREQQSVVEHAVEAHCRHRGWHLWKANARTNHIHVVVTAIGFNGKTVRDQLKANCTRLLREGWHVFSDRPVWTAGGDWQCINTEDDLATVIEYAGEAQDRMEQK